VADPIWLQKLKRALSGQSTPRPEFTGTAGYNQYGTSMTNRPGYEDLAKQGALVDPHLAAAAGGPGWGSGMAPSTMTKGGKKSNKLKYIVEALQELEGPEPPKLAGGNFGRAMPRALGFSLPGMGGRLEEQEAMSKARREEELRRRMKLMGGGY